MTLVVDFDTENCYPTELHHHSKKSWYFMIDLEQVQKCIAMIDPWGKR